MLITHRHHAHHHGLSAEAIRARADVLL